MSELGFGVMINWLGGNKETMEALKEASGKRIEGLVLEDDVLRFSFSDGTGLKMWDDGQSCCEHRYMVTDDDLSEFEGAVFVSAEIREGPKMEDEYEVSAHKIQFFGDSYGQGRFDISESQ